LNPTGALIWDQLVRHGDPARTVETLQTKFAGSPAEMGSTVQKLLDDLSREGLVVVDEA